MNSRITALASAMSREKLSNVVKASVISIGAVCLAMSIFALPAAAFSLGFLFILLFCILIAPRLSLSLPRSKFAISFADALIFLTFLLYGGPAAIFLAAVEMLASCLYLRSKGFPFSPQMIPANVSINAIYTSITFLIWQSLPVWSGLHLNLDKTSDLISALGILALSQFLISSVLAAVFHSLKDGSRFWPTWKQDCFSSSMTQIVGAG